MKKKTIVILLAIALMVMPVPIMAQDPSPADSADVTCDVSLAKCRTNLAVANTELAVFHSTVPGRGLFWKLANWGKLDGSQKTALIVELGTIFLALGASAYVQIDAAK